MTRLFSSHVKNKDTYRALLSKWHCAGWWGGVRVSHLKTTIEHLNWVRDKTHALGRPIQAGGVQEGVMREQGLCSGCCHGLRAGSEVPCLASDDLEKGDL